MPQITIVRPYEWANQQKKTYIYIDGVRVGCVGIDQTVHFDITHGKHTVELKQKWLSGGSKPLEVDLTNKEETTIKMGSFSYNWLVFLIVFPLITSIYQTLINFDSFMIKFVGNLLIVGVIFSVMHILFLRKRFIKLEEEKESLDC